MIGRGPNFWTSSSKPIDSAKVSKPGSQSCVTRFVIVSFPMRAESIFRCKSFHQQPVRAFAEPLRTPAGLLREKLRTILPSARRVPLGPHPSLQHQGRGWRDAGGQVLANQAFDTLVSRFSAPKSSAHSFRRGDSFFFPAGVSR